MKPLIIYAHDFSSDALSCLVVNRLQLGLKVVAIKLPMLEKEELLEDLAAFTQGKIVGDIYSVRADGTLAKSDPVTYLGKVSSCTVDNK